MKSTHQCFLSLLAALTLAICPAAYGSDSDKLAKEAFFSLEDKPFSAPGVEKAFENIRNAYGQSPKSPWVLIALSRAYLETGYISGDRSNLSSYQADAVEKALAYARQAVEAGPNESMAHVQLARMQIITQNYRAAWETLNQAYRLNPDDFYPWYYRSVIATLMKDQSRANNVLDEAEKRASLPYQKRWVNSRRISVASLKKDVAEMEKYYKRAIELDPNDAYGYGNYAGFLKNQKRYGEAVTYYEKAIAISPYPLAVEQLKKTRILKEAATQD